MNKETWIDEVIQSARTITPVAGNPYLYTRIEAALQQEQTTQRVQPRFVYVLATVMVAAIVLNIYAWQNLKTTTHSSGIQQVMQEYGWTSGDAYSVNYSK